MGAPSKIDRRLQQITLPQGAVWPFCDATERQAPLTARMVEACWPPFFTPPATAT